MFGESFFLKEHYRKTFIVCDSKKRSCVAGFGLRCLFAACSSSVLRPLFCGPPRFASRASDCAASSWRARPRCFAPFFAARPASRRGLRTALPLRGVLVLGASHPYCGPPLFSFPCPFLSKEKPPARLFRRPGACLSWLTFSPFSGQCRECGRWSSHTRCR